jgi:hypothetical protein
MVHILSIDPGFKNFAFVVLEKTQEKMILKERFVKNIIGERHTRQPILWDKVHEEFKSIFTPIKKIYYDADSDWDFFISHILIERQPVRNLKASMLAAHLYTYFYLMFPHSNIRYCNPKLKLSDKTLLDPPDVVPDLKNYNARKKESVRRVQNLLDRGGLVDGCNGEKNNNNPFNFFTPMEIYKKKDDLSDCILNAKAAF